MKHIFELNEKKKPVVRIKKSLNKYDDIILFPEKVEKAKEMLRTIGLPDLKKQPH